MAVVININSMVTTRNITTYEGMIKIFQKFRIATSTFSVKADEINKDQRF